jgi:uncharacterized integral membrane protein
VTVSDEGERREQSGRGRLIAIAILVVIVAAFVIDNTRRVKVGFVVGDHETRLIFVLIITLVIGVVIGWLWGRHSRK